MSFIDELKEKQRTDTTVKEIQDEFTHWFENRVQNYLKIKLNAIKSAIVSKVEKGETGTIKGTIGMSNGFNDILDDSLGEKIKRYNITLELLEGIQITDAYDKKLKMISQWTKKVKEDWSETTGVLFWKDTINYHKITVFLTEIAKKIFVDLETMAAQEGIKLDVNHIIATEYRRVIPGSSTEERVVLRGVDACTTNTLRTSTQILSYDLDNFAIPYSIEL